MREYNFFNADDVHTKFFADPVSAHEVFHALLGRWSKEYVRIYFVKGMTDVVQFEGEADTQESHDWIDKEIRD